MAEKSKVVVIDKGWKKIEKSLMNIFGGKAATVGFQGSEAEIVDPVHGGLTNVELAAIHEFGTTDGRIPERPMLRQTFDENQSKYEAEMAKIARKLTRGEAIEGDLLLLGEMLKADIITNIRNDVFAEWADSTSIKKVEEGKAGDVPLWDTGQLLNSLTAVITDNPDEKRSS